VPREKSRRTLSAPPLTIASDQEEIRDRILSSRQHWDTLWVDVVVTFYGPSGYIGPPYSERHQVWIDQDRGGLLVSGPMQGSANYIEKIILSNESSSSKRGLFGPSGYSKFGSQYPWFSIKTETVFKFPFANNYLFISIDQELQQGLTFSPVGEEVWAGQDAVIVDLISHDGRLYATLWLDSLTGINLREQYFDPDLNGNVIIESSISKIDFDKSMPTMWKRPTNATPLPRGVPRGTRDQPALPDTRIDLQPLLSFPFQPAPPNFDPSNSQLSFFKANRMDYDSAGFADFHIFADNNFLGDMQLYNPLQMICARSPDGSRFAFSKWSLFPTDIEDNIYWVDLFDIEPVNLQLQDTIVMRISFSPDNHTLAVAGYDGIDGQDKFYLVDIESGERELLTIPTGFGSIAWSPAGTQFAIMDWSIFPFVPYTTSNILVYDLNSREKIDEVMIDAIPPNTTDVVVALDGWTAEFHLPLQDLTHCTNPP
ncbi:MAG: hypothetical protein KAJ19_19850, partial [Gammaproteobacteria bacterium]|nr:hypothetical protein [Gammaproteobacteria bacterium]